MFPWDNKSSCEREVMLARGSHNPRDSSLPQVYVNKPLKYNERVRIKVFYQCTFSETPGMKSRKRFAFAERNV